MAKTNFNPDQLCTIEEAREFAALVTAAGIGGGVSPEVADDDYHNEKSGIYLEPWSNPTGDTPEPRIGDARPFKLRFNPNGDGFRAGGFNIGLSRQVARGHAAPAEPGKPDNPPNWDYALKQLGKEVDDATTAAKG